MKIHHTRLHMLDVGSQTQKTTKLMQDFNEEMI